MAERAVAGGGRSGRRAVPCAVPSRPPAGLGLGARKEKAEAAEAAAAAAAGGGGLEARVAGLEPLPGLALAPAFAPALALALVLAPGARASRGMRGSSSARPCGRLRYEARRQSAYLRSGLG